MACGIDSSQVYFLEKNTTQRDEISVGAAFPTNAPVTTDYL